MAEPCRDLELIDVDLLPPQVRELVGVIGLPETVRLLEARGGRPIYIPSDPENSSVLRQMITRESIRRLALRWPGETIDLPKGDKVAKQLRDQYIVEARRRGWKSGRELAAETGVTYRWVKMICAQARDDEDGQPDLFSLDSGRRADEPT